MSRGRARRARATGLPGPGPAAAGPSSWQSGQLGRLSGCSIVDSGPAAVLVPARVSVGSDMPLTPLLGRTGPGSSRHHTLCPKLLCSKGLKQILIFLKKSWTTSNPVTRLIPAPSLTTNEGLMVRAIHQYVKAIYFPRIQPCLIMCPSSPNNPRIAVLT